MIRVSDTRLILYNCIEYLLIETSPTQTTFVCGCSEGRAQKYRPLSRMEYYSKRYRDLYVRCARSDKITGITTNETQKAFQPADRNG